MSAAIGGENLGGPRQSPATQARQSVRRSRGSGLTSERDEVRGIAGGGFDLADVGEDDDTGAGLNLAENFGIDHATDKALGVAHYDHRSIGQITAALASVFSFADDFQCNDFAGEEAGAHGFREFVEVHAIDPLQLGDLSEIEVVGEKLCPKVP